MKKQGLVLPILGLLLSIAGTVAFHFSTRKSYWWTLVSGGIFLVSGLVICAIGVKKCHGLGRGFSIAGTALSGVQIAVALFYAAFIALLAVPVDNDRHCALPETFERFADADNYLFCPLTDNKYFDKDQSVFKTIKGLSFHEIDKESTMHADFVLSDNLDRTIAIDTERGIIVSTLYGGIFMPNGQKAFKTEDSLSTAKDAFLKLKQQGEEGYLSDWAKEKDRSINEFSLCKAVGLEMGDMMKSSWELSKEETLGIASNVAYGPLLEQSDIVLAKDIALSPLPKDKPIYRIQGTFSEPSHMTLYFISAQEAWLITSTYRVYQEAHGDHIDYDKHWFVSYQRLIYAEEPATRIHSLVESAFMNKQSFSPALSCAY
ncbi:MAG: hypothetical protein II721_04940 [Bacilli bacterium]|nr:hypothetical protein [Bacilli bacterium]